MGKGRLEAFSDGVMAIIITIMVLEIKVPQGDTLNDLRPLLPVLLSYVLSFVYVGIYWNNHHHSSFDGWLPSRLIPQRHRPRAELQPAHKLQVDKLR